MSNILDDQEALEKVVDRINFLERSMAEELARLEERAVEHAARVAHTQRMDSLNARVKALLGDEEFEFYTNTLIGYGMPRA